MPGRGSRRSAALLVVLLLVSASAATAVETAGVAATAHPLATAAAIQMLEQGGNAVDAAVAAAFAIGVVEPDGSGLGGGGGMLIHLRDRDLTIYINYYHNAPADPGAISFDSGAERNTAKSVLVPGTPAGLCLALEEYGTLPLPTVIEPAIRHARDGFAIDATLAGLLLDNMEALSARPALAEIFLNDGFPRMEGEILVQPALATVLQRISDHGRDGFYRGPTAEALVEGLTAQGGAMTLADLAAVEPAVDRPVRGTYRGLEIISAPAPHSGATLIQSLNMIESLEFAPETHFSRDAGKIHMLAEIFRRAYADRSQYLGDPRFTRNPVTGLTAKGYARARLREINRFRAEPRNYRDTAYGRPAKFDRETDPVTPARPPRKLRWADDDEDDPGLGHRFRDDPFDRWGGESGTKADSARTGNAAKGNRRVFENVDDEDDGFDGGHTTHLSVIDGDGNMVALTQTLGNFFGSKVMIEGILLNNGRVNFSSISPCNLIEPNKRPRSSITPTLVFRDGDPFMTLGSPGAGRIIATVAQVLINVIDYGMDAQAANDAPRMFCQKFDDHLSLESRVGEGVSERLTRMGHNVRVLGAMDLFFGGVQMAVVRPEAEGFSGSADRRRGGSAVALNPGRAEAAER